MFEQSQQDDLGQDLVNSSAPNSLNGMSSSLLETDSYNTLELNSNENQYIEESLANLTIKEPDLSTDTNNSNENQDFLTGEYNDSVAVNSVNFQRKALTDYTSLKGDLTNIIVGDYNGDGKDDFIRQEKGGWDNDHIRTADIYLSVGDGTFTRQALTDYTSLKGDLTNLIVGDYNGDGKDDFIRQEKGGWDNDHIRTADIYLSLGDGTFTRQALTDYTSLKGDLTNLIVGDYNGDGKDDFIRQEKGGWDNDNIRTADIYLSSGDGTFTRQALTDYTSLKGDLTNLIVGDYNGDGKDDFIRQEKGGWDNDNIRTAEIYLSLGDGTFNREELTDYKSLKGDLTNLIVGDYNGDGKDDFIRQEKGGWDDDNIRTADIYLANTSSGGGHNYNSTSGYGLVNAAAAVAKALGKSSPFPNVGKVNDRNWGVDKVKAPEVWNQGYTGKDIVVAVLDTGVDRNHSDLNNNIWKNTKEIAGNGIDDDKNGYIDDIYGWNFTNNTNNTLDVHGHGTHVSGTIAGERNNFGVTGIAYDAEIMAVKVLNDQGSGYTSGIAKGVRYAVDNGADVINMSLGGGSWNQALRDAIKYASDNGVIVVSAAGNSKGSLPVYPGRYATDWGLVVGAVDSKNNMASFSNRAGDDSKMAYVTAPGVSIYSTLPNNRYASWNGTSMATPHVAGIVALMLDANENLTDAQVRSIITSTAQNGGGFSSGSFGTSSVGSGVSLLESSSTDNPDTSSSSTDTGSEDRLNVSVTNPQKPKEAPFAEGLTVFLPDSETSNEGSSNVGSDFDHDSNTDNEDTSDVNTDNPNIPSNGSGNDSTPNDVSGDDSSNDGYGSDARYYDDSGLEYDPITGMPIGALAV